MLTSVLLRRATIGALFIMSAALAACGGGGGSSGGVVPGGGGGGTTVPAATTVPIGTSGGGTANVAAGSTTTTVTVPAAASGSGTIAVAGSSSNPVAVPLSSVTRSATSASQHFFVPNGLHVAVAHAAAATPAPVALAFLTITPSASFTFTSYPSFSVTLPASITTSGENFFIAFYTSDPAFKLTGWVEPAIGPATVSGQTLTFTGGAANPPLALAAGQAYYFCLYEQAAGTTPTPSPTPASTPTPAGTATPTAAPSAQVIAASNNVVRGSTIAGATSAIIVALSGAGDQTSAGHAGTFATTSLSAGTGTQAQSVGRISASSRTRSVKPLVPVEARPADDREVHELLSRLPRAFGAHPDLARVRRNTSTIPSNPVVGSAASIWVGIAALGSSGTTYQQVPATLEAQSAHGNIWIDNSLISGAASSSSFNSGNAQTTAGTIATDFENAYASNTTHFGTPDYPPTAPARQVSYNACDAAGNQLGTTVSQIITEPADGRINVTVLNSANLGNGVGGYFSAVNYIPQAAWNCSNSAASASPIYSNEAPMIFVGWFNSAGATYELGEDMVRGTAHEFQHLINFVNHSILPAAASSNTFNGSEDSFINEGLSMLAQDLAIDNLYGSNYPFDSLDALNHASAYLSNPQNYSVSGFIGIDPANFGGDGVTPHYNCGGGCYGSAYLFQRYMHDRFSGDVYTHGMETSGISGFANLVANCASCGETGTQLLQDFAIAMAVNTEGMTAPTQAYSFGTLNLIHGAYPSPLAGFTAPSLGGAGVMTLGPNATGTGTVPLGGFGFMALTTPGGQTFSLTDTTPAQGYILSGGLVQH